MSWIRKLNPLADLPLRSLYVVALWVHVFLVVIHIAIIAALPKARNACVPITYTYFQGRPGSHVNVTTGNTTSLQLVSASIGTLDGPGFCFVYASLAFVVFEVLCLWFFLGMYNTQLATYWGVIRAMFWRTGKSSRSDSVYEQVVLDQMQNPWRFAFYSVSASIMLLAILVTTSVTDLGALLGCIGCNVAMMACGYWSELATAARIEATQEPTNNRRDSFRYTAVKRNLELSGEKPEAKDMIKWTPFVLGSLFGIVPWIAILHSYIRTSIYMQPPWFVHGFLWQLFFFFNCFALVELSWTRRVPPPFMSECSYENKEWAYVFLSFLAKSILSILILSAAATMVNES